jgi:hypothetical protein
MAEEVVGGGRWLLEEGIVSLVSWEGLRVGRMLLWLR